MSRNSALILFVAVLASLLEIIDTSIVNVALPSMMGNLGATLDEISMVITGYAIANAIVLPVSAWLSEKIGRRKYYLGCIVLFTVTSIACGLAPNLMTLTLFRILQGLVGGALLPTSQTLIYEQFPKEKAGTAGAIFGMSVMLGPALGPVMGGYLTDHFGWRMIFNINLPLGIIALVVGLSVIKDADYHQKSSDSNPKDLDITGLVLLVLGIGCLQYVLERGDAEGWFDSKLIIFNFITTVICLPAFIWWELRVKNPIINIRLFLDPVVRSGVSLMACLGFFLYGVVFLLPVFMVRTFHYDATQVGEMFIPGSILTAMMMPIIGKLLQSGKNPKTLIFVGLCSIEFCCYLMTQFSPLTSKGELLNMLFVRGFALALLFVPINSSILSQFSGPSLGQVAGLLNLFRQIGGSIGIALVATLLNSRSHQNFLDLTSKISLLNPQTQIQWKQMQSGLKMKMSDVIGLNSTEYIAPLKTFYYRLQNQVFMMSFLQLVVVIMMIFSVSFIPWYFLKFKKKPQAVMDAH